MQSVHAYNVPAFQLAIEISEGSKKVVRVYIENGMR